jgi:DnaJ-class molecular chaperone
MTDAKRVHPAETGDSEAVTCPACGGSGENQYGQPCQVCLGPGFLLQQRRDAVGNPVRVNLVEKK